VSSHSPMVAMAGGRGRWPCGLECATAVHPLQHQIGIAVSSIAHQFNASAATLRSALVLMQKLARNACQSWCPKVDFRDASTTKFLPHELAKLRPMVSQPSEIVQTLVDDVLILASLVLNNHRTTGSVDSQRIDAAAVTLACGTLRIDEFDANPCVQVLFEEVLRTSFVGNVPAAWKLVDSSLDLMKKPHSRHFVSMLSPEPYHARLVRTGTRLYRFGTASAARWLRWEEARGRGSLIVRPVRTEAGTARASREERRPRRIGSRPM